MRPGILLAIAASVASLVGGAAIGADPASGNTPLLLHAGYLRGAAEVDVVKLGPDGALWIAGGAYGLEFAGSRSPRPVSGFLSVSELDAFVLRLDPRTRETLSCAWMGGNGVDRIVGLEFDAAGRAYFAGLTGSNDFLGNDCCWQATKSFVGRLTPDAGTYEWIRRIGNVGPGDVASRALCMTDDGDPVVVGRAWSVQGQAWSEVLELVTPLPGTADAASGGSAFAVRMSADGGEIVFSTTFGDLVTDVYSAVAAEGRITLAGVTSRMDIQSLPGLTAADGDRANVLVEIDQAGTKIVRSTGLGRLSATSMALRHDGLFVGGTLRAHARIPFINEGAPEPVDAQILRLDPATWQVEASAVFGGGGRELHLAMQTGEEGPVWLAGLTDSIGLGVADPIRPWLREGPSPFHWGTFVATFDRTDLSPAFATMMGAAPSGQVESHPRLCPAAEGGVWLAASCDSLEFPVFHGSTPESGRNRVVVAEMRRGDVSKIPATPTNLAVEVVDGPAVRVTFDDADLRATSFAVDRLDAGRWIRAVTLPAGTTEWIDTDVVSDRVYTYSVQALTSDGGSLATDPVRVFLPATLSVDLTRGQFRFAGPRDPQGRGRFEGSLSRLDGGSIDVRANGFALVFYGLDDAAAVVDIPAAAPGWTSSPRRRGVLRFDGPGLRLDFRPATGQFRARWSGVANGIPRAARSEISMQMRSGTDVGTTVDEWSGRGGVSLTTR